MGKVNVEANIEGPEQERLINAVSELLIFICKDNKELVDLEEEMKTSPYRLLELHPEYCNLKAILVENFLETLQYKAEANDERH